MAKQANATAWEQDGTLFRQKADEGKLVVVEVMVNYDKFTGDVAGAAAWKASYPSGDNVHVVADTAGGSKMFNAVGAGNKSTPFVYIIGTDYNWKLPEAGDYPTQMGSIHNFVNAL